MPAFRPIVGVCLVLALAPAALVAAPASPDTARATVPDLTVVATPFVWSGGLRVRSLAEQSTPTATWARPWSSCRALPWCGAPPAAPNR